MQSSRLRSRKIWKAHQLRSVRQEAARTVCLGALNESTVYQSNTESLNLIGLGSAGSRHIGVVTRKNNGRYKSQSFVHIVENISHDSSVVLRNTEHTLRSLKEENPTIDTAFLSQDDAECYHNSAVIASCLLMKFNAGIGVRRVDFSVLKGDKGFCGRKAATIETQVRR